MKIKILSNQKDKLVNPLKEFEKVGIGCEIEITPYFFTNVGRQEYLPDYPGKYGIAKDYVDMVASLYPDDIIVIHYPEFKVEGAGGWHSLVNGKSVIQLFGDALSEYSRNGEFQYWIAELLTHELCHHLYRKHGLVDNTHLWHYDNKNLLGAVNEIKNILSNKADMLELLARLYRKLISLKEQLAGKITETVQKDYINEWALAIQEYEGWKEGSLTYRHNNPGALRWSPFETGNKNGFSIFPSYEDGFRALKHQLTIACNGTSGVYSPDDTLFQFFSKYAPASDNNNPKAYAQFVANKLGVTIDTRIKSLI